MAGARGSAQRIEVDDLNPPPQLRLLRHEDLHAGVTQDERQPLGRRVRIHRQIGGAGLENAQRADDHFAGPVQAQPDDGAGTGAEGAQLMGQPVGPRVQLLVGDPPTAGDNSGRIRSFRRAGGDQVQYRADFRTHGMPCP